MNGKYDFTPFLAPYPSLHPNITKGAFFNDASRDILTALEEQTFREYAPNYCVYSKEVYLMTLIFFVNWCVMNVLATFINQRRKFTTIDWAREVLKGIFTLITAYMKNIRNESSSRILQLSLLISVTVGVTVYNARFSNENIRIHSPKVYTTYKSLKDDPPEAVVVHQHDLDSIDQAIFRPSSPEMYLKQLRPKIIALREFMKLKREREMKIVVLSSTSEIDMKGFKFGMMQRGLKKVSIIKKQDPNAVRTLWHATVSKSTLSKPGGQMVMWTFKAVQEYGLIYGILRYSESLVLHIPMKNPMATTYRELAFGEPTAGEAEVGMVKNVGMDSFKRILSFFSWVYLSACLSLTGEIILYTTNSSLLFSKNKVRPFKRPFDSKVRPRTSDLFIRK